jgi:hypothetical protein
MRCALGGANESDRWPLSLEIKVDLIPSLFVRRRLPFFETIEGVAKEK